jgi:hypothetical protein
MRKQTKTLALLISTLASIMMFLASLCAIESDSWLPIITLCVSGAWCIFGFTHLDDWGAEDVDG